MKRHRTATPRQSHSKNKTSPRHVQTGAASGKRFLLIMLAFAVVLIIGWGQCARTRVSGAGPANLIFALNTSNQLLRFSAATPGTLIGAPLTVSGLVAGDALVGIDFRPATGQLYTLGVNGANARLYTINVSTGAATQIGGTIALPQSAGVVAGADYGFDFNPTVDRIRVVADSRDNFRLNPDTGTVAGVDTALTAGAMITGAAYDRNYVASPQPATTLYGIDSNTDQLVTIGGVNSVPSPNTGQVFVVGNLGFNTSSVVGFDVTNGAEGTALASLNVNNLLGLYSINLATGAATPIGSGIPFPLVDIAVAPAGTVQFSANAYLASESAGPATITVTRKSDGFRRPVSWRPTWTPARPAISWPSPLTAGAVPSISTT